MVERVGTQDEPVGVKTDIAKRQISGHSYRIKIGLRWPVGRKRIVMAVEHDDGMRGKDGHHGKSLGGGDAHGEKALPIATKDSAARAELLQDAGGKLNGLNRGLGSNAGRMRGGSVRDKRNG